MASYKILREVTGVLVKVPKMGVNMRFVAAHEFTPDGAAEPVKVDDHWRHGQIVDEECGRDPSEGKAIMNRHFYGLGSGDFGKRIVADVKVCEKSMEDGKRFVFCDITKTSASVLKPEFEVKLVMGFPPQEGDISVGKIMVLRFTPYVKRQLRTDAPDVVEAQDHSFFRGECVTSSRAAKCL